MDAQVPEPNGPLTPDDCDRARAMLKPQQFVVYKNHRDGMTVTLNASRAGVSRTRIRHIIHGAQVALGYEPTHAAKQVTAGTYTSVKEQRARETSAQARDFLGLLDALASWNPANIELLEQAQSKEARAEMAGRLEGLDGDEYWAVAAEYLAGPAREQLRKLAGSGTSTPRDDFTDAARHRHDDAEREAAVLEDLGGQGYVPDLESAGST
jgi:hypothetical protein